MVLLIQPEWLERDPDNWPIIDDQQVDVTRGLTEHQASQLVNTILKEKSEVLAKEVPNWDMMKPELQAYFVSFAYNAGGSALKEDNAKAFKALENGDPVDAMLHTFDYWNTTTSGGKRKAVRGLLNRRLNDYNRFAENMGLPQAVSYEWGGGKAKVKFDGKLTIGVRDFYNKDSLTLKSKSMEETESQTYTNQGGLFQ